MQRLYNSKRADQRIAALRPRRSASVAFRARHFDAEGSLSLNASDDADVQTFILERDALLDMRLDEPCRLEPKRTAREGGLSLAKRCQRLARADPAPVLDRLDFVEGTDARKRGRTHHSRRKPRPFLVHPRDQLDRAPRPLFRGADRLQRLKRSDDAIGAVELTPCRLAVGCEPISKGARLGSEPGDRRKRFEAGSTEGSSPIGSAHSVSFARAARSSHDNAKRLTPPPWVAP